MNEPVLKIETEGGITVLTMNRPDKLNALSRDLRRALVDAFRALADDDGVGVVILTGAGRAFSAGLDLKELGGEGPAGASGHAGGTVADGADIVSAMAAMPQPIIGAVNGFAVTGGFEIALACDFLVASTEARFADTHARVGILPGWGLSQKLSRQIGIGRAKELSLTGNYLEAERAEAWGLVNRVVEPDALLEECRRLAADIMSCEPSVMRAYKKLIDDGYAATFADGLALETDRSSEQIRSVSPDAIAERRLRVQERGRDQG